MKKVPAGEMEYGQIRSEGKILEITPLLYMGDGTLTALPPTAYVCPNWLLGFEDYQTQGYPYNLSPQYRDAIPGSNSRWNVQLGFMVRVYENNPGMVPNTLPTIPEDWAELFAQAVKTEIRRNADPS